MSFQTFSCMNYGDTLILTEKPKYTKKNHRSTWETKHENFVLPLMIFAIDRLQFIFEYVCIWKSAKVSDWETFMRHDCDSSTSGCTRRLLACQYMENVSMKAFQVEARSLIKNLQCQGSKYRTTLGRSWWPVSFSTGQLNAIPDWSNSTTVQNATAEKFLSPVCIYKVHTFGVQPKVFSV